MDMVYLSKSEKEVLRIILFHPEQMEVLYDPFFEPDIVDLETKGFIRCGWASGHELYSVEIAQKGRTYITINPKLKNPVDWEWILQFSVTCILTIATIIGLFIACSIIG